MAQFPTQCSCPLSEIIALHLVKGTHSYFVQDSNIKVMTHYLLWSNGFYEAFQRNATEIRWKLIVLVIRKCVKKKRSENISFLIEMCKDIVYQSKKALRISWKALMSNAIKFVRLCAWGLVCQLTLGLWVKNETPHLVFSLNHELRFSKISNDTEQL